MRQTVKARFKNAGKIALFAIVLAEGVAKGLDRRFTSAECAKYNYQTK